MVARLKTGRCVFAVIALAVMCLGLATPALAEGEGTYALGDAMLTAVIVAPADTDASQDGYTFHFAGGGEVVMQEKTVNSDVINVPVSDSVEQDGATIKEGDIVPAIGDVTLTGVELTADNSLTNGQMSQAVVQKPLSEVLSNVTFPHAGVYTYVVTERSATTKLTDGTYINASKAEYTLRIRVKNSNTGSNSALGNEELTIESVTVEQKKNDSGTETTGKIDPTYPKVDTNGKISETAENTQPVANTLAGDANGCNVPGFTFANKYIKGGSFQVKKLYDGDHSDRTKYSSVKLTIHSAAAAHDSNSGGNVLTYRILGEGIDTTNNKDGNGDHLRLNGVYDISQANDYMVEFNEDGWVYITADLKEDSVISVTGMFGPYDHEYASEAPNGKDKRETIFTSGLMEGLTYYVIEDNPGDYRPTGYVYEGTSTGVDPRKSATGMTKTTIDDSPVQNFGSRYDGSMAELPPFALFVEGTSTGSATTVFVVNTLDENKVSPTGILIDNLPYVLMVGVPLVVFAGMFVMKRRRNAAA